MLDFDFIDWDNPVQYPRGNVAHIRDHDISPGEVEEVLYDPRSRPFTSRSSGRPAVRGTTATGREIIVIYEILEDDGCRVLRPATAYDAP